MAKQKVLIVGKLPPPYIGPAVATKIILSSALKEDFDLLHLNTKVNHSIDDFGKGGIGKLFKNISIYFKLFQLLRKSKVDLILVPISQTTLGFLKDSIFILIASLFSTKILLQLRGSNFKNWLEAASTLTEKYVRFCFNRTKGIIVLGNNLKHLFEDYFNSKQIYVVPNGCDISIVKSNGSNKIIKILYFSNLLKSKGILELIKAIHLLKKANNNLEVRLDATGSWYDKKFKDTCLDMVKDHKLPIHFHSPVSGEEKWDYFKNADLFVFIPNEPEGHPWSIVEAMAASLPIISTNQGAIIESVLNEYNGFIVDSNSIEQIANKIELLLKDENLRIKMGENSFTHYNHNFMEKHMVENLSNVFKKVIA